MDAQSALDQIIRLKDGRVFDLEGAGDADAMALFSGGDV